MSEGRPNSLNGCDVCSSAPCVCPSAECMSEGEAAMVEVLTRRMARMLAAQEHGRASESQKELEERLYKEGKSA